jgi:hypothetical protein
MVKLMFAILLLSTLPAADIPAVRSDDRRSKLESFLSKYHCSVAPISEYLRAADTYGLDYRVLPAISIRETACGKSNGPRNNFWGFHQENFQTLAEGIDFLARRLMLHPLYQGKTLRDKLLKYNPRDAYPGEVLKIMRQIE